MTQAAPIREEYPGLWIFGILGFCHPVADVCRRLASLGLPLKLVAPVVGTVLVRAG